MEPSRAGGASINGMALLLTIVQRATAGAAGAATRHPANAVGARRVAPPKADTKPNMLAARGMRRGGNRLSTCAAQGRVGGGRRDGGRGQSGGRVVCVGAAAGRWLRRRRPDTRFRGGGGGGGVRNSSVASGGARQPNRRPANGRERHSGRAGRGALVDGAAPGGVPTPRGRAAAARRSCCGERSRDALRQPPTRSARRKAAKGAEILEVATRSDSGAKPFAAMDKPVDRLQEAGDVI